MIASELKWIKDDNLKDEIYERASMRLSERSGRTAMPALTRTFRIPSFDRCFNIKIHEPSLTADLLGLKTWAASYLLAKRLHQLDIPCHRSRGGSDDRLPVLELGSGTGLVGISAAAVLGASVFLTDLPEIADNLYKNAISNLDLSRTNGGTTTTAVLDWSEPHSISPVDLVSDVPTEFPVIMAADSIYAPEHPSMLARTISKWLSPDPNARVVIELPIRPGFSVEHNDLRLRMSNIGLTCLEQGHETGYDDWGYTGKQGDLQEVECWWSVWGWRESR
jgi:Lysine methyltransferase